MASAIIATVTFLPLLFSQPCQREIAKLLRYLGKRLFPKRAQCVSVTWDAAPDVLRSTQSHCQQKQCWSFIVDWLLNGLGHQRVQPKYIDKPDALDLFGGNYLCIDVPVLLAIVLCSVGDRKSLSWREGAVSYDQDFSLRLRTVGGDQDILLAHVSASLKHDRMHYTKAELTALMQGYPPWYRERVVCSHGPSIPYPIRSNTDILRGGWVVAVGLADRNRRPMALYTVPNLADSQSDSTYNGRGNGTHLRQAVNRVHEVLKEIALHIPDDSDLKKVIEAVHYMITTGTGSGVERYLAPDGITGGNIAQLDGAQCIFAMSLFNTRVPSDGDIQTLRPILAPVLKAAFDGCYKVIQDLKDDGMRLVLPHELGNDWSRKIYLRDCVVADA